MRDTGRVKHNMGRLCTTAMYSGFIIIIIIIISITATAYFYKTHKSNINNIKESFQDTSASLDSSYKKQIYERDGIQACTALSSAKAASSNYIDTLRIRQWKPAATDSQYQSSSNTEYCYFFMDDNKTELATTDTYGYTAVKDPLATVASCAKTDALFKDVPFIQDAFVSTDYDRTHNLPYKKCILKLDKEKLNEPNAKDAFWNQFGNNDEVFCQGIENTLQNEINSYIARIENLTAKLNPYRNKYGTTSNLKQSLDACTASNLIIEQLANSNNNILVDFQKTVSSSNIAYSSTIAKLESDSQSLLSQKESKSGELANLQNNLTEILAKNIQALSARLSAMMTSREKCASDLASVTNKYNSTKEAYDSTQQKYRTLQIEYNNCERNIREAIANIEQGKPSYDELQQKLEFVKNELMKCTQEQLKLQTEERNFKNLVQKTQDHFNKCNESRSMLEAQIESMKQKKESLVKEIEEIKRRCRDDQSNFNLATVNIHREASKDIIATEQEKCKSSIAMRQRKTELLNELNGILLQAESCDRIVASCKCFKYVGEFPWNDQSFPDSANTLKTSSGRIVEIRKLLQSGATHVKFASIDGQKSAMYKVGKTRKKQGSGSYIVVDGPVSRPGGKQIAKLMMYQVV